MRLPARKQSYEIRIGSGLLTELGSQVRACLGADVRRIALISNKTVFDLYGRVTARSFKESNFEASHWLMKDGEQHKSLRSLQQVLSFLGRSRLERTTRPRPAMPFAFIASRMMAKASCPTLSLGTK